MSPIERDETATLSHGRRPHRLLVIATVVMAVLCVAAIIGVAASKDAGAPPAGVDPIPTDPADLIGTWRPTFMEGVAQLNSTRPHAATVALGNDSEWRGSDGCNGIGGTYDANPGEISVESGPQTAIGCDNVPNVEVLGKSAHFRVNGIVLTLYDVNWNRLASYSRTQ